VEQGIKPNTHCDLNDFITTKKRNKILCILYRSFCGFSGLPLGNFTRQEGVNTHIFMCQRIFWTIGSSFGSLGALVDDGHFFYNFRRKWIGKGKHNAWLKIKTNNLRAHNWGVNETRRCWKGRLLAAQDRISGAKPQSVNYPGL